MKTQEKHIGSSMSRVDGHLKVTGGARYSAEYELPGMTYGVLVGSTIAKGRITSLDTKAAERAPGVLAVLTHLNAPKVPGFKPAGKDPSQPRPRAGR
ncbi:hypothetical protein [Hymenobacter sp. BRD67]|uniref:hypothetical protein n=1 Tax=Hymenobacter sp. BRD67 TaxID=2675877 RepID=UPI0015640125|nr:hypothetical protein [Hymenobacter sp. BRD67]QKG51291.1 hypothetical protein GKZ67_00235 [Hymenobacter sp. BRD67]